MSNLSKIKNAKVIGAGSIGNHMANSIIELGANVNICDISIEALNRTKNSIYPNRYKKWNDNIGLYLYDEVPKIKYDLVVIGTPPDTHKEILLNELKYAPKAILIEKPLFKFNDDINQILNVLSNYSIKIFSGYNHTVSIGINILIDKIKNFEIGEISKIEVKFLENWKGIFKAHPWLDGPADTYLGFWNRGGGALSEHSHGLNLLVYLFNELKLGSLQIKDSKLSLIKNEKVNYDEKCIAQFVSSQNILGYLEQDVITEPTQKTVEIFGQKGKLRWQCNYKDNNDALFLNDNLIEIIEKNRKDDFKTEILHIDKYIDKYNFSPLRLELGINTMEIINKIYSDNIL